MTYEICHRVGIRAPEEKIFDALTDTKKIPLWWSHGAEGTTKRGATIKVSFGEFIQALKIEALEAPKRPKWVGAEPGAPFWKDTEITFELRRDTESNQVYVYFTHAKWREKDEIFLKCCTHWAAYMMSLKNLVETGTGNPHPKMIPCDHDD
jgi:uncharacterized protein YndB with AHSA1/START domain